MKKRKLLICALSLILAGAAVFLIGFIVNGSNPSPLLNAEEQTFVLEEPFTDIEIDAGSCNITIEKTDGQACVKTKLCGALACEITAEHGVLTIRTDEYMHFGLHLFGDEITVCLPEGTCKRTDIRVSSGNVTLSGISFGGNLTLSGTSGNLRLTSVSCEGKITADTSSGSIHLDGVNADSMELTASSGNVSIKDIVCAHLNAKTSSGNIRLDRAGAESMELTASSGNISGGIMGEMVFECSTGSGSVHVPETTEGGLCRVKTGSGDIHIEIAE